MGGRIRKSKWQLLSVRIGKLFLFARGGLAQTSFALEALFCSRLLGILLNLVLLLLCTYSVNFLA